MKIAVVTGNRNKASEIAAFFGKYAEIEHVTMDLPEIRHDDVGEIARKKAEYAYSLIGRPLLVDDTAFSIEALRGFPGPCAAYVHDTIGNPGILKLMEGVTDRRAYFETAIALATDAGIRVFRGRIEGMIVPPRGSTDLATIRSLKPVAGLWPNSAWKRRTVSLIVQWPSPK